MSLFLTKLQSWINDEILFQKPNDNASPISKENANSNESIQAVAGIVFEEANIPAPNSIDRTFSVPSSLEFVPDLSFRQIPVSSSPVSNNANNDRAMDLNNKTLDYPKLDQSELVGPNSSNIAELVEPDYSDINEVVEPDYSEFEDQEPIGPKYDELDIVGPESEDIDSVKDLEEAEIEEYLGLEQELEEAAEEADKAEGPEILNNIQGDNNSPANLSSVLYKYAKLYANGVDTGLVFAKHVSIKARRFSAYTAHAWRLGAKAFVKEEMKTSIGVHHYKSASETLKKAISGKINSRVEPQNKMCMLEAFGVASEDLQKGLKNSIVSASVLTAASLYAYGMMGNALGAQVNNVTDCFVNRVNTSAYTAITVSSTIMLPLAKNLAKVTISRLGVTAAGMAIGMYYASDNYVKAVEAPSYTSKVKHGALAVASLAATVTVPYYMYA